MEQLPSPLIQKDLITYLDKLFKNECPSLDKADKEVWYSSGQRSVVNFLIVKYESQSKTPLTKGS